MTQDPARATTVVAALLVTWLALPAAAQLSGFWQVRERGCTTTDDGERDCCPSILTAPVTQNGSQLSGTIFEPQDLTAPGDCQLMCTPDTPECALRTEVQGTITGSAVHVTAVAAQTLHASCDLGPFSCQIDRSYRTTLTADGTVSGRTINGTFSEQTSDTCDSTGEFCDFAADCVGDQGLGSFDVRITDAPPPNPGTCFGDCNRDRIVTPDEALHGVAIALGQRSADECPRFDLDDGGRVRVEGVLRAINAAADWCQFPAAVGCNLGGPCVGPEDCPVVDCGGGSTVQGCGAGYCLVGSCICAEDVASCCEIFDCPDPSMTPLRRADRTRQRLPRSPLQPTVRRVASSSATAARTSM